MLKMEIDMEKVVVMFAIVLLVAGIPACMAIMPHYNVWKAGMDGQALLKEAEQSRQIAIQEANAKMESAKLLANAEIERAKGVAEANKIIGESLANNEAYLRYLWITEIGSKNTDKTVVYVPTEANLPILEAGKR